MKSVLLLLAFLAAMPLVASAESPVAPELTIRIQGSITITDGTYLYTFKDDGTFNSVPFNTSSGRTISGRWHKDPQSRDSFIVEGRWGWMNGLSSPDDYRRVVFKIAPGIPPDTHPAARFDGTEAEARDKADGIFETTFTMGPDTPVKPPPKR